MNEENNEHLNLKKLRKEINKIDNDLVNLIDRRVSIASKIGKIKKKLDLEIYQPNREQKILEKVSQFSNELSPNSIQSIYKEIISACRSIQGTINNIGFLGPKGTFTHQAALQFFPTAGSKFTEKSTIFEIFDDIEKDLLNFGVIPIENSLQGTVRETLDLLIEKNLNIYEEIELKIKQNLLVVEDIKLSKIQTIYSHPQAFAQTRTWIKANMPHSKLVNVNSTAEAAKMVQDLQSPMNAAIGTNLAANLYNLNIKHKNIEDESSNFTRFLIISKKENPIKNGKSKSSIVFVTQHLPGSLYKVLALFSDANINLLKIESRPRKTGRWEYIFLMDFEGHKEDIKVRNVLKDLKKNVIWYKVLGSYPLYQKSSIIL